MRLGQDMPLEVWLNVFAGPDAAGEELSDVISRHPAGSWPELGGDEPVIAEEREPGPGVPIERPPPGEPSPYWYLVGPGGLFYWQWAALGTAAVAVLVLSSSGGRRR